MISAVRARLGGEQREQRLTRQIEALLAEEEQFARRRVELVEREQHLQAQMAELERRAADHRRQASARAAELRSHAARLAERERAVDERMKVLEETARRRARELAHEAVAIKAKEQELLARGQLPSVGVAPVATPADPLPQTIPEPQPRATPTWVSRALEPERGPRLEPIPVLRPGAAPDGGWNLDRLERWVEERGARFPGRVEEWRYYVVYMREFADMGGILPSSFDRLVWDAFGDLLGTAP